MWVTQSSLNRLCRFLPRKDWVPKKPTILQTLSCKFPAEKRRGLPGIQQVVHDQDAEGGQVVILRRPDGQADEGSMCSVRSVSNGDLQRKQRSLASGFTYSYAEQVASPDYAGQVARDDS